MILSSVASAALAFLLTLLFVPVVISLCHRWQVLDCPGPLKTHRRPIPRLGGVALVLAVVISVLLTDPRSAIQAWPLFAALALVWTTGLIDDMRNLSVLFRFAAQIGAGVLLWRGGWVAPMSGTGLISLASTCVIVVAFVNALNFIDGSDGVAAGAAGIVSSAYAFALSARSDPFGAALACAVAGACFGFLPFNLVSAKAFLGDSGSTALGCCVAFFALDFWRSAHATPSQMLFPLLVAALPLLDGALAIIRRLVGGVSPLYGDRDHIYDKMLARGWSAQRVAFTCYAITAEFVAVAWWGLQRNSPQFWFAATVSFFLLALLAVMLGSLRSEQKSPVPRLSARDTGKNVAGID